MCGGGWIGKHKKELLTVAGLAGLGLGGASALGLLGGAGAGAAVAGEGLAGAGELAATGVLGSPGAIGAVQAGIEGAAMPSAWETLAAQYGPAISKVGKVGLLTNNLGMNNQPPPLNAAPIPVGGGMQVPPAAPSLAETYAPVGRGMSEEERRRRLLLAQRNGLMRV